MVTRMLKQEFRVKNRSYISKNMCFVLQLGILVWQIDIPLKSLVLGRNVNNQRNSLVPIEWNEPFCRGYKYA